MRDALSEVSRILRGFNVGLIPGNSSAGSFLVLGVSGIVILGCRPSLVGLRSHLSRGRLINYTYLAVTPCTTTRR